MLFGIVMPVGIFSGYKIRTFLRFQEPYDHAADKIIWQIISMPYKIGSMLGAVRMKEIMGIFQLIK